MNQRLIFLLLALSTPLAINAAQVSPPAEQSLPPSTDFPPPPPMAADHGKQHGRHLEMVTKELGLSNEQKGRVKDIFEEQRVKMKAIHEETRSRMRAVLTPEQLTKFENIHKDRHPPKPE